MPVWLLASLGGVFVFGVLLIVAGLFLPTSVVGSVGWPLAVLGLFAFVGAAGAKWALEGGAARQLEACRKQLTMLDAQTKQVQDERTTLDTQLPAGGTLTARLQAAEAALAALDQLLPLDSRRQTAEQEALVAAQRADQAREDLRTARKRWRGALKSAQLPEELSPKQLSGWMRGRTVGLN